MIDISIHHEINSYTISLFTINLCTCNYYTPFYLHTHRIVQSFESIIGALVGSDNFTNVTIIGDDIAVQGERVSYKNM